MVIKQFECFAPQWAFNVNTNILVKKYVKVATATTQSTRQLMHENCRSCEVGETASGSRQET